MTTVEAETMIAKLPLVQVAQEAERIRYSEYKIAEAKWLSAADATSYAKRAALSALSSIGIIEDSQPQG